MADQNLVPVGFRLPQALLDRVDAFGTKLAQQTPGLTARRSDVIRILLERALSAEGLPAGGDAPKGKRAKPK